MSSSQRSYLTALDRMLELTVFMSDDMTQSLARDGLTVSRAHLLWELARLGPSTQRTLADALTVSARNVTGLVDGLVATGFVTREPHPADRRAFLVSFTERGRAFAAGLERDQREFAEQLFGAMPEAELVGFTTGLDYVLGRLRELTEAAAMTSAKATGETTAEATGEPTTGGPR